MPGPETLLGLVSRTASWPQRLEAWSLAGAVPFTVSYCQSVAHLQARLDTATTPRGVLLDGDLSLVDRDLLAGIAAADGVAVVIAGARRRRQWRDLGAAAALPNGFEQHHLLAALRSVLPADHSPPPRAPASPLVAVTGAGGTGASVTAIAVAQGLAAARRRVLLVDCCLHAEQAMLHNAHGGHAGLLDVIDLHAERSLERHQVRQLALGIVERGYYLLPGLTRARHWSRVPSGSLQSTLRAVREAFDVVVADIDPDVEGEAQGGSIEVEERNVLARTVALEADAIVVVGQATMKGVHALVRVMAELLEIGLRPERLLPVLNHAPAAAGARAELGRAVGHLMEGVTADRSVRPVLYAPTVELEEQLREREAVADTWATLLAGAVTSLVDRSSDDDVRSRAPEPVAAGTLGHWADGSEDRG
jgi:MinD-like ATPase involved in chromosome partitioning or flagellar assembly